MTPPLDRSASEPVPKSHDASRLHFIDATRAFALILGIVFHASLSFVPIFMGWAVQDVSTSSWVAAFATISHSFRMELFFLLAGFLGNLSLHRRGISKFARSRLIQLGVPFIAGWFVLRPFLVSAWIMGSASLRGDVDILTGLAGGFQSLATIPRGSSRVLICGSSIISPSSHPLRCSCEPPSGQVAPSHSNCYRESMRSVRTWDPPQRPHGSSLSQPPWDSGS
jgi:hypothetical protein